MISIIVIGKNEAERLPVCLDAVHRCMGPMQYELLYIDSRSADNSVGIAGAHGAKCCVLDGETTTAGLGRRVGTGVSKGEYLLFLDGDMELLPGFIQKAMMVMASEGFDGAVGIRSDIYLKNGKETGRLANYFNCHTQRLCPEFGGALFIKREALEKAGGWSGDPIACEESELHARLDAAGSRIVEIPVPMFVHYDKVRDNRGVWSLIFSRRRLGEGQAYRCAANAGKAAAYRKRNAEKFRLFAVDLAACLLVIAALAFILCGHPPAGLTLLCAALFSQTAQFGWFLAKGRARAFVSQKLFFFALPLGWVSWRPLDQSYHLV